MNLKINGKNTAEGVGQFINKNNIFFFFMQFVLFATVSIETKSNCSNLLFSILNVPFSTSYYILKICIIF